MLTVKMRQGSDGFQAILPLASPYRDKTSFSRRGRRPQPPLPLQAIPIRIRIGVRDVVAIRTDLL